MKHLTVNLSSPFFESELIEDLTGLDFLNLANALGFKASDQQKVLDGIACTEFAAKLGWEVNDLQILMNELGKGGIAALFLGSLIRLSKAAITTPNGKMMSYKEFGNYSRRTA